MVSAAGSKTAQRAPVKQASEQSVPQSIPTRRRRTSMKARAQRRSKASGYPRDMVGYGKRLPDPKWPGQARLALQISLNYEAGGELNLLHGDRVSEAMLTDIGFPAVRRARSPLVESSFEYGSRRGVWRLLRLFEERKIVVGILAVATALARNREVAAAMVEAGHEIVSITIAGSTTSTSRFRSNAAMCGSRSRLSQQ